MRKRRDLTEVKTDLDALSLGVAGQPSRNGHGETDDLARDILEQRKFRLQRQNKKLDLEIARHEMTYGDLQQFRNQVLRCNQTVKNSLREMVVRASEQLVLMDDRNTIQAFLMSELDLCFNGLAYENTRGETPAM